MRKEEIACTSNFSFSHNVSYNYISLARQNVVLCDNGLMKALELSSIKSFHTDNSKVLLCDKVNSLPSDKILEVSKFKAFADNIINVTEKLKFALRRVENIGGKRRKCWLPAFSPFPTMFSKGYFVKVKS